MPKCTNVSGLQQNLPDTESLHVAHQNQLLKPCNRAIAYEVSCQLLTMEAREICGVLNCTGTGFLQELWFSSATYQSSSA